MTAHPAMTSITIPLSDEQLRRLDELASRLNVSREALVRASIDDLLARPADDFRRAVDRVLSKNADLYRRLE